MSFKKLLSRTLGLESAEVPSHGPKPVRTSKHHLAMEAVSAQGRELQLFGEGVERVLSVALDGKDSAVYFESAVERVQRLSSARPGHGFNQLPGSETAALQLYASMRAAILGGSTGSRGRTAALVLAGPVVLVAAALLFTPTAESRKGAAQVSTGSSPGLVMRPAGALSTGGGGATATAPRNAAVPKDAYVNEDERMLLAGLAGVAAMRPTGKEFYVFSDPNCPFCKDLEPTLDAAPSGNKPVVIPVAFKEGSRDLAAAALCSPNPAAEWKKLMATGATPTGKVCQRGLDRLDQNMELFRQLRLTATPTIVSPKGLLVSGAATPDELAKILAN